MASKRTKDRAQSRRAAPTPAPQIQTSARSHRLFLVGVTLIYLLLAATYNRLIPFRSDAAAPADIAALRLATNPDEAAHVANALVYKSGRIPRFTPGSPDFEAHQPPLYYALIAPTLSNPRKTSQPAKIARWVSIVIGALMIWAVYACLAGAFPSRTYLAAASAAFVGLLPMNVNLCASITNDVLANLIVVLALWQIVRIINGVANSDTPRLVRESVVLGLIMALGIYTKTSTLVLFPTLIVGALALWRGKMLDARNAWLLAVVPIVVSLLAAAPWLIRNTQLYGDPVAQHIFMSAFLQTTETPSQMMALLSLSTAGYVWLVVKWTFESFWGVFDSMKLFVSQSVYDVLALAGIASLCGAIRWYRGRGLTERERVVVWVCIALIVATLLGFARFNATFFQAQGRYLYLALLPLAFFFCRGLSALAKRESPAFTSRFPAYMAGALVLLNAYCVYEISSVF